MSILVMVGAFYIFCFLLRNFVKELEIKNGKFLITAPSKKEKQTKGD
jgi:hypothetical protein